MTSTHEDAWRPGLEVDGHVLLRPLGQGGMGAVWRVAHAATGAERALKVVRAATHAEDLLRFQRVVEALGRLDGHPNVVRVHSAGVHLGAPWVVTELVEGGDLDRRLRSGPLAPEEAAALVRDVARGVAHAHARGVLHRDIKPANVLLDAAGVPRLADFGLARLHGAQSLTQSGALVGTPAYMAPEQALGLRADERTDVWGLGAVLYHALSGQPPGVGTSPMAVLTRLAEGRVEPLLTLRPDVPQGLDAICRRALAPEPAERWPGASSLATALEQWLLSGEPPARSSAPRRGWLAPVVVAIGAALALAAALGSAWSKAKDGPPHDAPPLTVADLTSTATQQPAPPPPPPAPAPAPAIDWPARMAQRVARPVDVVYDPSFMQMHTITKAVRDGTPVSHEDVELLERLAGANFAEAQTALARVVRRRGGDRREVVERLWIATRNPSPDLFAAEDLWEVLLDDAAPSADDLVLVRWLLAEGAARALRWAKVDLARIVVLCSATHGRNAGDFGRALRLLERFPEVVLQLEQRHRAHPDDPTLWVLLGIAAHEGWGAKADLPAAGRLLLKSLTMSSGPPHDFARLWLERHGDEPEWRSRFRALDVATTPQGTSLLEEWTDADRHFATVEDP